MTAIPSYLLYAAASGTAGLRWLRVSQREHYAPGRAVHLARQWVRSRRDAAGLAAAAAGLAGAGFAVDPAGWVGIAAAGAWPVGLDPWVTEKPLRFTPRLTRLAAATGVLTGGVGAALAVTGAPAGAYALPVLAMPALVDAAAAALAPLERRGARRFAAQARDRLRRVHPTVVAITGSYGKTSTKNYVAHLVAGTRPTVASPASFNNLAGLSRTVNEQLTPGTEVFVAEMGTYGPGEIRALCEVFPPDVAAITVIGTAHLERMGSREAILRAKSEITERASTVVLPVDQPELAALAERLRATKRVITCSLDSADADVVLKDDVVYLHGQELAHVDLAPNVHRLNVVVAVALAVAVDVPPQAIARRLADLPDVGHRQVVQRDARGLAVIDDTYNANPTGARAAVDLLVSTAAGAGRTFLVTPGMIELGAEQDEANAALARYAAERGVDEVAVVGHTNRRALARGARAAGTKPRFFPGRRRAVAWVSAEARPGDVVLYENDLPDHYP